MRCGASYIMSVIGYAWYRRSFLTQSCVDGGKKPMKINGCAINPEATSAFKKALQPEIGTTLYPRAVTSLTTLCPGSLISGYPASEIKAILFPCDSKLIMPFVLDASLKF